MSETVSGAALLARVKPTLHEKGVLICLIPGLVEDWEEADAELTGLQQTDSTNARLGSGVSAVTRKAAERVRDLEDQIEASQARFVFRAMPKDRWQALCDMNPPRPDDHLDIFMGHNRQAVSDAAVRVCLIDPVFEDCTKKDCTHTDCGTWDQFISVCNPSEWHELRSTCDQVNGVVTDAPKSVLASRILDKAASTSKPRKRGE